MERLPEGKKEEEGKETGGEIRKKHGASKELDASKKHNTNKENGI